ncbi:MAG: dihydropteroate synthase, partial [Bacteroidaceae bacterium]|nr:dihydropteroate synthase [Bacteroidaceae bacterium]
MEKKKYINIKGCLFDLSTPQVMGILNVTPDSFYVGSRMQTEECIAMRIKQIIDEGASIIDIGAYSSHPNADDVTQEEEMYRLSVGLNILNRDYPDAVIS